MIHTFNLWKKLLWATVVSAFSTSLAFPYTQRAETSRWHSVIPDAGDPHLLEVQDDTDGDLLSDLEEIALGYDEDDRDMNDNWFSDGLELARLYHCMVQALPIWDGSGAEPNAVYRMIFDAYGVELCEVCGAELNMGFVRIVNPLSGLELDVENMALHFMQHGSFSFDGTVNDGRVDIAALAGVLHDAHVGAVPGDSDGDFLADVEESQIGFDSQVPDEDGNWIADGKDLAGSMAETIAALPEGPLPDEVYRIDHLQYGIEVCAVCGGTVNMGYVEIVNPMIGESIDVDYIALHAMEHQSFDYEGDIHEGRVDLVALKEILEEQRARY